MARRCARPTCSAEATVTLSYGYADREVWLDSLSVVDDPANHDLCACHADRVTAPQGWVLHDRRAPAAPIWQARAS